jgi:hypothetical protein
MWPVDQPSKPAKILDDLWSDIQRVKERMLTFLAEAQRAAEEGERLGTFDSSFYGWLEPMVNAAQQMQAIQRNGPHSANVILFDQNLDILFLAEAR